MRVVFDTNILVSAFVSARGRGEAALLRTIEGSDRLLVSKAIIDELLAVLARKFSRGREQVARIAVFLADIGELVDPELKIHRLADDPDNRILECAVDGHADAIVTGDRALLQLKNFGGIPILTLKSYLSDDSDT